MNVCHECVPQSVPIFVPMLDLSICSSQLMVCLCDRRFGYSMITGDKYKVA